MITSNTLMFDVFHLYRNASVRPSTKVEPNISYNYIVDDFETSLINVCARCVAYGLSSLAII